MLSGNVLLHHKTSNRQIYDQAWQKAVQLGGFDAIFTNEKASLLRVAERAFSLNCKAALIG